MSNHIETPSLSSVSKTLKNALFRAAAKKAVRPLAVVGTVAALVGYGAYRHTENADNIRQLNNQPVERQIAALETGQATKVTCRYGDGSEEVIHDWDSECFGGRLKGTMIEGLRRGFCHLAP